MPSRREVEAKGHRLRLVPARLCLLAVMIFLPSDRTYATPSPVQPLFTGSKGCAVGSMTVLWP
jgi:hypothetical protein